MEEKKGFDDQLRKSFKFQNRELLDNYVMLALTDKDGTIKHVSTSLCNVFDYKPSELIDKPYTLLIKKDSIINFNNQFKEASSLKTVWKGEVKHSSFSDSVIWTDTIITPLFDDNKEHIGFIITSNDITKEKILKKVNEENLLKKKYDKSTLEFMSSFSSAILLKTSSSLHKVLWLISFTLLFLLTWSYFSEIDDIVKTNGKVITSTNIQTISSLEGGILKESFIKEGDKVKKGEVLFNLSDVNFKSEIEKNRYNLNTFLAKAQRLKAQAENTEIKVNKEVIKYDPEIMENEIQLFKINEKKYQAAINILKEQLSQRKNDLKDAYKNLKITENNFALIQKEMKIKMPLVEERIISKVELLDLQRKKNDVDAELKTLKGSIPTLKSSIKEIERSIDETKEDYRSKAKDELLVVYNDIKTVKEDLKYLEEKLTETIIKSPDDGIIKKISVKTKGEAVSPGTIMAQIVPDSKYMLAEIKVDPADIGFLYEGQEVRIKLRPYDFSLYGSVKGEISYISADTLIDEKDPEKENYIVHIKAETKFLNNNKKLEIKPGMTVDADILIGKKTILSYILKPIVRSLDI
ncbi:hypothetical protein GCM10012288_12600 [Malaciobacter pacificus]|uniref:Type I secretion system membrane fusion protein, HlyD family (PAS domain) n=1 Tax=Malaciobacter pacificus TaxID=1080223 RepID=A0A5C2H5K0_9BACT|nr:HlyD family type I secretion periplasmic adaptor subunit [Malaciobacter pacificus]QEP34251.1 type I secretion system membrane fusion protein, HlyD family (PAS domain) [Malaciobacter pacificus]GGD40019.1 hypothetical protein GCM10012288_12600 [Malaciobacter pacificus]